MVNGNYINAILFYSFRRGSEKSGDVDVLITYNTDTKGEINCKKTMKSGKSIKLSNSSKKANKRKDISDSSSDEEDSKVTSKKIKQDDESTSSNTSDQSRPNSNSKGNQSLHREMLQSIVEQLKKDLLVTDTLSLGDTKFMVSIINSFL